jgi:hypothetical protein
LCSNKNISTQIKSKINVFPFFAHFQKLSKSQGFMQQMSKKENFNFFEGNANFSFRTIERTNKIQYPKLDPSLCPNEESLCDN